MSWSQASLEILHEKCLWDRGLRMPSNMLLSEQNILKEPDALFLLQLTKFLLFKPGYSLVWSSKIFNLFDSSHTSIPREQCKWSALPPISYIWTNRPSLVMLLEAYPVGKPPETHPNKVSLLVWALATAGSPFLRSPYIFLIDNNNYILDCKALLDRSSDC